MNRRSFLTRLASGVVGLSLVDVEWIPTPIIREIAHAAPLTDLNTITAEYLRRLVQQLSGFRASFVPGDYAGMDTHLGIDFMVSKQQMERGLNPYEFIDPAAGRMADEIQRRKFVAFGALPTNLHAVDAAVATDELTGVTVRGLHLFDLDIERGCPHWEMRFDVFGKAA